MSVMLFVRTKMLKVNVNKNKMIVFERKQTVGIDFVDPQIV